MTKKLWNWRLWVGFLVAVLALVVYGAVFIRAREVFWVSLVLFLVSGVLLASGLRRAFGQRESYRGRVAGPILATCSALTLALFAFLTYEIPKHFAAARNAPRVGQLAPQFTLVNTAGKAVSLTDVLTSPLDQSGGAARAPKGVLLVFYRGYW